MMNNDEDDEPFDVFDDDKMDDDMDEAPLISTPVVVTWVAIPVLLWMGAQVSDYVHMTLSGFSTSNVERR